MITTWVTDSPSLHSSLQETRWKIPTKLLALSYSLIENNASRLQTLLLDISISFWSRYWSSWCSVSDFGGLSLHLLILIQFRYVPLRLSDCQRPRQRQRPTRRPNPDIIASTLQL